NTGLYTAPPSVSAQQTVTVRATSAADSSRFATSTVTLNANGTGARPITIYNTGVFSPGVLADYSVPDPHYTLIASADTSFPAPNAFVTWTWPVGAQWMQNGAKSSWIAPQSAI